MGDARKNMEYRQHSMDAEAPATLRKLGLPRNAHKTATISTVQLPYAILSIIGHTRAATVISTFSSIFFAPFSPNRSYRYSRISPSTSPKTGFRVEKSSSRPLMARL